MERLKCSLYWCIVYSGRIVMSIYEYKFVHHIIQWYWKLCFCEGISCFFCVFIREYCCVRADSISLAELWRKKIQLNREIERKLLIWTSKRYFRVACLSVPFVCKYHFLGMPLPKGKTALFWPEPEQIYLGLTCTKEDAAEGHEYPTSAPPYFNNLCLEET